MEVHVIPITNSPDVDKFIVYRPRLGVAFVSNRAMANLAEDLANDTAGHTINEDIAAFLDAVGFFSLTRLLLRLWVERSDHQLPSS